MNIMCFDAFGDLIEYMLDHCHGAHSFATLNEIENPQFDGDGDAHDKISSCVNNQCRITVKYDTIYALDEFW